SDDPISRIFQNITVTIILFNSRASGKENPDNDYDICIMKKGIEELRKASKLLYQALCDVGVPIEPLVETPESFNIHKTNPHLIYRDISDHGKIIL
ncbi:MAG: nucleotidyltransferase domain-containing protein, partial [Methanobacteriota archaeon]